MKKIIIKLYQFAFCDSNEAVARKKRFLKLLALKDSRDAYLFRHFQSCQKFLKAGYKAKDLSPENVLFWEGVWNEPVFYQESARRFFSMLFGREVAAEEVLFKRYAPVPGMDMRHMIAGHYLHEDCVLSAWCCDGFYIGIGLKPVYGFIGGLPFSVIETSGEASSAVYCLRLSRSWLGLGKTKYVYMAMEIYRDDETKVWSFRPKSIEKLTCHGRETPVVYLETPPEEVLIKDCRRFSGE